MVAGSAHPLEVAGDRLMSLIGQQPTSRWLRTMSAYPSRAAIRSER
jgi:hypothetical protein